MRYSIISLLGLLLMLPLSHPLYPNPPLANVTGHNRALAFALNSTYNETLARNGTVQFDFYGTDRNWAPISRHFNLSLVSAYAQIMAMDPSIDESTSPSANPVLTFAWGEAASPFVARDWDGDDCTELPIGISVLRNATINFTFGNASAIVNASDNRVEVPERVLRAMESTDGDSALKVSLNATFDFTYEVDDRRPSFEEGCSHHPENFTASISMTDQRNWTVEGNRTLFFMTAPILGEQWFANNRFDVVVLSNYRISRAAISSAQGVLSGNYSFFAYNISNNTYGVWSVVSVPLESGHEGASAQKALNTPTQIDPGNSTYSYAYQFNSTYPGLGENTLTLEVFSEYGGSERYSRTLVSRMLTYSGNTTEAGTPAGAYSRPSAPISADNLQQVMLSLGAIGLLLTALLLGRYYKK